MFFKDPDELTVTECSHLVGIQPQSILRNIHLGKLKAEKRGKSWFIKKYHLREFIDLNTKTNY